MSSIFTSPRLPVRIQLISVGEDPMRKDITEKDINRAMKEFGVQVKAQANNRQDMVIAKLRKEIDRLKPQAQRLLHGET